MTPPSRLANLLAAACFAATATATAAGEIRLLRSLSGPSGKVEGAKFAFDQLRNRFVYPQDKSLIVYFEWEAPPGAHVLTAFWKQPDGRTAFISPDVKIVSTSNQLNSYWTFILTEGMARGIWSVDVRIDGQPAGSQPIEIVAPEPARTASPEPAAPKPPTTDEIFRNASRSMVWVYKIDAAGRREDTSLGFVTAKNRIATAFQAIDASTRLELEFSDGRKLRTDQLAAWSRTGDWALIDADTAAIPALASGDPKLVTVGERLIAFNVENTARAIGGVDISGRRVVPGFGERIQISPALGLTRFAGPLTTAKNAYNELARMR